MAMSSASFSMASYGNLPTESTCASLASALLKYLQFLERYLIVSKDHFAGPMALPFGSLLTASATSISLTTASLRFGMGLGFRV